MTQCPVRIVLIQPAGVESVSISVGVRVSVASVSMSVSVESVARVSACTLLCFPQAEGN